MSRYNELVNNLLLDQPFNIKADTYFLSLYVNTYGKNRSQIETYVKSLLKQGFEKKKNLGSKVEKEMSKRVLKTLNNQESFKRGLAIFCKFSLDDTFEDIKVLDLNTETKEDVYIGKAYDLDQLIWINNMIKDSLVVNLQINDGKIYLMSGSDFTLVKKIELELDDDLREFVNEYNPIRGIGGIFQSGGGRNKERERREFLKMFFGKVLEYVEDNYKKDSGLEYVVVFHSKAFDFMSDEISKKIKKDVMIIPLVSSHGVNKENELPIKVSEEIKKFERTLKRDLLKKAKRGKDSYVVDWYEVCQAVNLSKVEYLFVSLNATKEGYEKSNGLIYTQSVSDSRKVNNIATKIIRKVLEQGGKVYVFEDKKAMKEEIGAMLRY